MENVPIHIDYKRRHLTGVADPVSVDKTDHISRSFMIYLEGKLLGKLSCEKEGWVLDKEADRALVETIGSYLHAWYE